MTREEAQRIQYRHATWYVVYLVGPAGEKVRVGRTQRKTGTGLMNVLRGPTAQAAVAAIPGAATARFKKFADRLEVSNGWRVIFGGTILDEATPDAPPTTPTTTTQPTLF